MPDRKRRRPKGIVDTSVLVAGLAGLKSPRIEPSQRDDFVWLFSEEILTEYRTVLTRLRVQHPLIGWVINILRKRGEKVVVSYTGIVPISPDPGDEIFCVCAEQGLTDFIVTLNLRDFPQDLLNAHVIAPGDRIPTTRRGKQS